jgi:hypothetical protein
MRVQLAAAIAKAAAARFVQDDVDDGLPIHTLYEQKVAGQALDLPDLPLYHVPSQLRHVFSLAFFLCVACLLACFCTVSVFCFCWRSASVGSQCHFCTISSTLSSHRFCCF